jgi:putative hydrolase of the HAD superfamily
VLKAFIFDLGNVLLLFSHERMYAQVAALCGRRPDELRRAFAADDLGARFERGEFTEEVLQQELERRVGAPFERHALHRAIADIFTPSDEMLRIVDDLRRQGFRLVLLSNTNSIHIRWIESQYDVLGRFDACVLSHEVGALKPERVIYAAAIGRAGCAPGECFYTDDVGSYVAAARECGLHAEVFTGPAAFLEQAARCGVELRGG